MIRKILDHKFGVEFLLLFLTIFKVVIVYLYFQNIVVYENGIPRISDAFAWGELIHNMHDGEYFNTSQYTLSDLYNLKFHALRPPVYSTFLYLITYCGKYAGILAVIVQSIATSLIAYFSYKIIKLNIHKNIIPGIFLLLIFFLPFNFFKSGSIDDAVFMLLFLLVGMFFLIRAITVSNNKFYVLSGLFFGLALLTRPAVIFPLGGIFIFVFIRYWEKYKGLFLVAIISILMLSPWIIRNYYSTGDFVYTNGGGRILLLMQSEEFIDNFPEKSIDYIDRTYFTNNYDKYKYVNQLSENDMDTEFVRLAVKEALNKPFKFIRSIVVKLKVFIPLSYYPLRGDWQKSMIYLFSYWTAVALFIVAFFMKVRQKIKSINYMVLLVSIIGYSLIGVIMFMLSRHFYPLIVFLFISSGIIFSELKYKFLSYD